MVGECEHACMENSQLPVDTSTGSSRFYPSWCYWFFWSCCAGPEPRRGPWGCLRPCRGLVRLRDVGNGRGRGREGVWDAILILFVVWPALLLYQDTDQAGGYDVRQGIIRFSRDDLFIVIALGWVFASFLQSIAGFGTPIAIVAPLLFAFGVRPVYAVVIPIIAHLWARFFGSSGSIGSRRWRWSI